MRTIQMTLDDELVVLVDALAKKFHTSRSAFARDALWDAVKKNQQIELETKHRKGYEKNPVEKNEFNIWEPEQEWGDT